MKGKKLVILDLCEEVYENRGKTLKKDHLQQSHTEMEK